MRRLASAPSLATMVFATIVASIAVTGCGAEDDSEPAVLPRKVAFEGQVDAKYVGAWTTADGGSKLDLAKDGALKIATKTPSPTGVSDSEYVGQWLASGGKLLLQYKDSSGETTLEYAATLTGNKLVLQQPGGRLKTTYTRK